MSYQIPIIFDTDLGVDDAYALLLAAGSPTIRILGITTVFGNNSVENCTDNVQRICELLNLNVPVAKGASKGLFRKPVDYSDPNQLFVHGEDGLGGKRYMLKESRKPLDEMDAVDMMARLIRRCEDKVVLVPVGPLTNIATFLMTYPELKDRIDGIALMGGAAYGGNALLVGEANIVADPEAAQIVFQSGCRVVMCGLDATNQAYVTKDDLELFKLVGGGIADFYYEMIRHYSDIISKLSPNAPGPALHDSVPVAWLIRPEVLQLQPAFVQVDLDGRYTRTCTATDFLLRDGKKANAMVATGINRESFIELHVNAFKRLNN